MQSKNRLFWIACNFLSMNRRSDTILKSYFSWPSFLNWFFYVLKNKDKKWTKLVRKNIDPNACYQWTYNFLELLNIANWYSKNDNKFSLTEEWKKLYGFIKNIDDSLLYTHDRVDENKIYEYNKELEANIWSYNLIEAKKILFRLINKAKWFLLIKEVLENKEFIIKSDLYLELAKRLNVSEWTIKNIVPSMLQLVIFLDIFILEDWKLKKNIEYFIWEIYERKEEDVKVNNLIDKIKEEKTIDEINDEIRNEEIKWKNKKDYYIIKKAKMLSRNNKLALLVKERAGYICESCGSNWFETKYEHWKNYMEAHHLKELAYWWEDKWDNMVCLCIECHWKIHHWSEKVQEEIYNNLKI